MIPVELTAENWVDQRLEFALSAYDEAVSTLAALLAARQNEGLSSITPNYLEQLQQLATQRYERASRLFVECHAPTPKFEVLVAEAELRLAAHSSA